MEFTDLGIKEKVGATHYYTTCPECDNTRTKHKGAFCLSVHNEQGNRWYKCHHCGWSGNLDTQGKYDKVREESKIPTTEKTYSLKVREYLNKRGISLNTAKKVGIYEFPRGKDPVLGFPYFMHMTLVNVKFLNMEWKKGDKGPKWYQLAQSIGTRIIPFGMNMIKTHSETGERFKHNICIITEGEWDMLSWKECGYTNVVSVPQGAPSLNSKDFHKEFAYLQDKYVQDIFGDIDTFYLSTDNDEPGKKLQYHLSVILGKDKCRILKYPVGYKDANEVLAGDEKKGIPALGKKALEDMLRNAQSVPIKGVIKASQVYEDLNILRNEGFLPGLGCGVKEVDRLFTVKPKHVSFVTGVPGCFAGDQKIITDKGNIPIALLKPGYCKVLTYNHETKRNEFREILEQHIFEERDDKLLQIELWDNTVIKVTEHHEFWQGYKYRSIKDILRYGLNGAKKLFENILAYDNILEVKVIDTETTYDLTIEGNSNYYLATESKPILVHNSGKSVWTRWWLTEMIKYNESMDLKWALFTPENRPVAREYAKIAETLTGLTIKKGQYNSMSDEQYKQAMRFIEKHFFIISPDKKNFEDFKGKIKQESVNTLDSIEEYVSYLKKTENIFGYVIDAWNKIEHEQPKYETETQFISKQLDRVINFNDLYDLHGIIIVHPRKIEMVGENYKMPSLYDIKGSSAWKEKADIGIIIHRYKMRKINSKDAAKRGIDLEKLDEDEKWEVVRKAPTIIRTEKIRFEETGVEDRVKMEMNSWGKFTVVESKVKSEEEKQTESKKPDDYPVIFGDDGEDDNIPF